MKSYHHLSEQDIAELFLGSKVPSGWTMPDTAQGLVAEVEVFLRGSLDHRIGDAAAIASAVFGMVEREPAPQPEPVRQPMESPEAFAWRENMTSGWGDQPPYPGSEELPPGDMRGQMAAFLMGN